VPGSGSFRDNHCNIEILRPQPSLSAKEFENNQFSLNFTAFMPIDHRRHLIILRAKAMAAENLRHFDPFRNAGTIKRVIRRGDISICGVCRSQYRDHLKALSCVNRCWHEYMEHDPVIIKRGLRRLFQCRFCARQYKAIEKARSCAQECKGKFHKHYLVELKLVENLDLPPPPKKRQFQKQPTKLVVNSNRLGLVPDFEDEEPYADNQPQGADEQGGPCDNSDLESKSTQKQWRKEGAMYVCQNCSEQYYTRVETIKCWESHG
jgi:hypothetical protein